MKTLKAVVRNTAIGIAVVGSLAAAMAATGPTAGGFGPGPFMGGQPPWAAAGGPARLFAGDDAAFAQFQQERLADLKSRLAITQEQQPAWDTFAAKATEQAQAIRNLRASLTGATAQEWVALRNHMMAERQKSWAAMNDARATLGTALTPEQRAILDQMPGPMRGPR